MTTIPPASHRPAALAGLRVIEFAGIGPGPFAGMLLADMGADVVVIERASDVRPGAPRVPLHRNKRSIVLDLKSAAGVETAWRLLDGADALIEGFRPGVMERLGFGPEQVAARNPKLIYGRVTGWGQDGPLAQAAGHDINYVALSGALSVSRRLGQLPAVAPTVLGDMAGGGLFLSFGIACALLEARRSGQGQVVDAAIVDGVAALSMLVHTIDGFGAWPADPERNYFQHASPFYDVYECADGQLVSLGAIEPQFYAELLARLGLDEVAVSAQHDVDRWPQLKARMAALFRTRDQAHWCSVLEGSDACFAPVLDLHQARSHPHNVARASFVEVGGKSQPAPAPRLSRTPARAPAAGPFAGEHGAELLAELGLPSDFLAKPAAHP